MRHKYGIGVITVGKRPIRDYLMPEHSRLVVVVDEDRRGPAWARNQCLAQLDDCEHIFLFDDDTYPVMRGWAEYWSSQCEAYGITYSPMVESFKTTFFGLANGGATELACWNGGIGAACYQHRDALAQIGGYNDKLVAYGFEDAGRLARWKRATNNAENYAPIRLLAYIHPADVFAEDPTPSWSVEEKEAHMRANHKLYEVELTGPVFMPYK